MKSNQSNSKKIVQYKFLEEPLNALQQANSLNRNASMHNPNLKEFLRKLNELEDQPTSEQFAELEVIMKREEDFMMPLIQKGSSNIRMFANLLFDAHMNQVSATSEAFSLKIMQEAVLALKGGGKLYNKTKIEKKSIEEVRTYIIERLQETKDALINSTNHDLSNIGVLIQDKRDDQNNTRIFMDKPVNHDKPLIEDGASRFAKDIETLGLTPAQKNYLKMSISQASFAGMKSDIKQYLDQNKQWVEHYVINIIVKKQDAENIVFLELSSIFAALDGNDNADGAIFYTSRIDLSDIEEEEISIGGQNWAFLKNEPSTTTTMITAGMELDQVLLTELDIIEVSRHEENSQQIIHGIANDCCTHIVHRDIIMQNTGIDSSANSIERLQNLQKTLQAKNAGNFQTYNESTIKDVNNILRALLYTEKLTELKSIENAFDKFLAKIILYIQKLINAIALKDLSLVESLSSPQEEGINPKGIKKPKSILKSSPAVAPLNSEQDKNDEQKKQKKVTFAESVEREAANFKTASRS